VKAWPFCFLTASKEASLKISGHDAQLEFWKSPAKFRAFVGGRESGKSSAFIVGILSQPAGSVGQPHRVDFQK
jgi:hypothetical protein